MAFENSTRRARWKEGVSGECKGQRGGGRRNIGQTVNNNNNNNKHNQKASKKEIRNGDPYGNKEIHGGNSNQFIHFCEPHDALIYIVTRTKRGVADGVRSNKIGDAPGVEH